LEEISDALGLDTAPLRIECFDVSQIQGTDVVAGMVVFEDGLARRSEYRRFAINGATDDVSAISEVLRRRFLRYKQAVAGSAGHLDPTVPAAGPADPTVPAVAGPADPTVPAVAGPADLIVPAPADAPAARPGVDPETGRVRKFAYPPQLLVVDGGQPQVNAAARVLADLGVTDVAVCGLAKRLEEVWLPDEEFPVVLPRASEALYLLQRVRDEAHRFAITYHRQKRSKRMIVSDLDAVPGLGEVRRQALLRHFGSAKRLRMATVEEIVEVPGIGRRTAEAILTALGVGEAGTAAGGQEAGGGQAGTAAGGQEAGGGQAGTAAGGRRAGGGDGGTVAGARGIGRSGGMVATTGGPEPIVGVEEPADADSAPTAT
jgi:excinuclease ABC subunit C